MSDKPSKRAPRKNHAIAGSNARTASRMVSRDPDWGIVRTPETQLNGANDNARPGGGGLANNTQRNPLPLDFQEPNRVQPQDSPLRLTISAEALRRIRSAIYESGTNVWQSPTSLAAYLGFTGEERRIAFVLWAMFGVDAAKRTPCIDWDDQEPLFDECVAGEAVEWREVNVVAFAREGNASSEMARVIATLQDVRILHCVLYCASGNGGYDFSDVYRVVDALGTHLPATAVFCWTQIFLGNEEVDNGTGAWPVAGMLLRVASLS